MKKSLNLFLICLMLFCTACSAREPVQDEPADYSGRYTDKQGTTEVYSELALSRNEDGTYAVELRIYRTISMLGTAAETEAGKLHFDCYVPDIHAGGDIVIAGETAELTITESDTYLLDTGMVYRFPDGE